MSWTHCPCTVWAVTGEIKSAFNPLTPNDHYSGRTAPLTSKRCILYIYSTNIGTEYFKQGTYSLFFSLQNAVCFIILTYLVPVLFTFYIQCVLKLKFGGRTAPLTSKRCILYIYSTNTVPNILNTVYILCFFPLQNAVCFIILTYLVPVLFTFYIQSVLKLKFGGRTAPLTSKRCILYIYSTNTGTEYFKHGIYSPFLFSSKCSLFHNS